MASGTGAVGREIKQGRPFTSRAQEATLTVLRTADWVRQGLAAVIEPFGVTLQQYNVLRILRGSHPEPLPTLEIGERLIERAPAVTRLVDRLEARGLVRRDRSADDRRVVHCRITREGQDLLRRMDRPVDRADAELTSALSEAELARLIHLLDRVRGAAP